MGIGDLPIKLDEAKQAIAIPDFRQDDLLELALTDPCTLNESGLSKSKQEQRKREYRRLAFLGDTLIDAILAGYLYSTNRDLTQGEFDKWRQKIADRDSLTRFAISLGLPDVSSSWKRTNRRPPEEEPGTWGEMFEALVAVIFLDGDRGFMRVSDWLCDRFLCDAIEEPTILTGDEYADMLGLPDSFGILFSTSDGD